MTQLPIFPLKSVLLPGNEMSLKIFEPRYIDMIASCMREDKEFGIVLIYSGEETTANPKIFNIGTSAKVTDWQNREDGLLGVTVTGQRRFQILSTKTEKNGLLVGEIEYLEDSIEQAVPDQFYYMSELLKHVSPNKNDTQNEQEFNKTVYQLIYLLPLDNSLKQNLLEVPSSLDRAVVLHAELIRLGIIQYIKP